MSWCLDYRCDNAVKTLLYLDCVFRLFNNVILVNPFCRADMQWLELMCHSEGFHWSCFESVNTHRYRKYVHFRIFCDVKCTSVFIFGAFNDQSQSQRVPRSPSLEQKRLQCIFKSTEGTSGCRSCCGSLFHRPGPALAKQLSH